MREKNYIVIIITLKHNHRLNGRVIEYGQEWFVLPKGVKETLLSAAKDELNVDKATGKTQMVTFLSNCRKAEELNIKVRLAIYSNDIVSTL